MQVLKIHHQCAGVALSRRRSKISTPRRDQSTNRPFVTSFSSIAVPLITPPLTISSSDDETDERRSRAPKRYAFDDAYIWGLIRLESRTVLVAGLCLILCTMSNLAAPVLSGQFLEALVQQKPIEEIQQTLCIMAFSYLLEPILTKVYVEKGLAAGEKVLATLRCELFRILLMQKISYYDTHKASELAGLISVELDTIRSFLFNNSSRDRGPRAFLEAFGCVMVLFWLSWRLAPVCSIVICATATAAIIYKHYSKSIEQQQGAALQKMSWVALNALENMRTVRSFAGESLERERFQESISSSYQAGLKFGTAKAIFEATNRGSIHLSLLTLYTWGGWLVMNGLLPLRVLISGLGFTFSLTYASQGIVNTLTELRRASGALGRIRQMISSSEIDQSMAGALPPGAWWEIANGRPPHVESYGDEAGDAALIAARHGSLELRNVSFSYPVRPGVKVLDQVILQLPQGSVTAVVGRSGSGKTTIANLLTRFYEPQEGGLYLDSHPVSDFTLGEWSRAVAMVGQEPVIFAGTIADNIAYGSHGTATMEQIIQAATSANAHDFIVKLPLGYATLVGERGTLLSGGQRQRIALARALLKDSPILILDEATSSLDTVSEKLVQQAVARLVTGRTVVVIAHRLSTVQNADQIVVMHDGQIVEVGHHTELSNESCSNGKYYRALMSSNSLVFAST